MRVYVCEYQFMMVSAVMRIGRGITRGDGHKRRQVWGNEV